MKKINKDLKFIISVSLVTLVFIISISIILSSLAKSSKIPTPSEQNTASGEIILNETEMFSRAVKKKDLPSPSPELMIKLAFKLAKQNTFL